MSELKVMSSWKTTAGWAAEGLAGLPGTRQGIEHAAQKAAWRDLGTSHARKRKGRGGGWEYHVSCLPDAAQADWRRRQVTTSDVHRRLASVDAILRRQVVVLDELISEVTHRRAVLFALLGEHS